MGAASAPGRLGVWWLCAAVGLVGMLLLLLTGHVVGGAAIMAIAFGLAAWLRAWLPRPRLGGLQVRSRALDVVHLLSAAVNLFGAALMVGQHIPWQILGGLDVALLVAVVVVLVLDARSARARQRRRRGTAQP